MIDATSTLLDSSRELILSRYASGESIISLARSFDCDQQRIRSRLKSWLGKESLLPDPGNSRYFQTIDTFNKAYFLGFIAADGAIVSAFPGATRKTLTISIHEKDRLILDTLKREIGNEHPIQILSKVNQVRFTYSRREMITDLENLGITERKSLTLANFLVNVPVEFRKAAIMGYFDGDGSISFSQHGPHSIKQYIQIRATDDLISGIMKELPGIPYSVSHFDAIPNLRIGSIEGIIAFMEFYSHCDFYLPRKYDKFISLLQQVQTISSSRKLAKLRELGARVPIIADLLKD